MATLDDLLQGVTFDNGARFIRDVLSASGTEQCVFWPHGKNGAGYASIKVYGKSKLVHRLVCTLVKGDPPSDAHVARHVCGNGHLGCVNPLHLHWGTEKENWQDTKDHGRAHMGVRHVNALITPDDVRKIRAMRGLATQKEIGAMFGLTRSGVQSILDRRSWNHVD